MKLLTTQAASQLAVEHNLCRRIHSIGYDQAAKVHKIAVTVGIPDNGRTEHQNYYVFSEDEIYSQEAALNLATSNFLGQTFSYVIKQGTNALTQETSHGESNEESSEESNKETSSEGKEPVGKKKNSRSKKSSVTAESEATPSVASEVSAPVKEEPKKKPFTTYNRADQRHVDILTSYLTTLVGGDHWKQNPNITQFSISLVGKDFIDDQGQIVPSFSEQCRTFFKVANGL